MNPAVEHYENLVIGSGEAGKYLAWAMAKTGRRTALVERRMVGGSCPNVACLPTKNVIHSARVASLLRRASEFGLEATPLAASMAGVFHRKQKMVDALREIHIDRFEASGAHLITGEARFTSAHAVEVRGNDGGVRAITADRVFLNLGTRASVPEVPGLVEAKPMMHVEFLDLQRLPAHLVVVGAALLDLFRDESIDVLLNTNLREVKGRSGHQLRVIIEGPDGRREIAATDNLVAVGRTPNTQSIGLEQAGVALDQRGYIVVNDRLETTAPNAWAMGDCAGTPQFTHAAFDDYRIVLANLNGGNRSKRDRVVPFCMFTDPELVRIGLDESEAKRRTVEYRLAAIPMAAVLRTRTISEPRGFIKMLIAANSDEILGFTALGVEASELLAAVQTAMLGGLPYTVLRDGIFTHPTIAEGLVFLLADPPRLISQHRH